MKRLLILLLCLVTVFALASCGSDTDTGCTVHNDANGDGKCDSCQTEMNTPDTPCTSHTDEDGDGKCDDCGATVEVESSTVSLFENGEATFQFVLGDKVNSNVRMTINDLIYSLEDKGVKVNLVADNASTMADCEILIGDVTSRGDKYAFDKYSLGKKGYIIKAVDNKIIVNAGEESKIIDVVNMLIDEVLGFEYGYVEEIPETLTFTTEDNIIEIQDDYAVTSLSVGGVNLRGATIAVDRNDTLYLQTAQYLQDTLYTHVGYYLPIVSLANADERSIILKSVPDDGEYGFKIYSTGKTLSVECGFKNTLRTSLEEFIKANILDATGSVDFAANMVYNKHVRTVTYEQFGAKGNGKTDDYLAMREAHDFANEGGQTVIAKPGATYYIKNIVENGTNVSIKIMTNVIWEGATIIIDDTDVAAGDPNAGAVFAVLPNHKDFNITLKSEIERIFPGKTIDKETTTKINYQPGYTAMLQIVNTNEKHFIRKGYDSEGSAQRELIIIDGMGNLIDNTSFMFDYEDITSIIVQRVDETPITIKGGTVRTLSSQMPCLNYDHAYIGRGINMRRSNVTIDGLVHEVVGEEEKFLPDGSARHAYSGFITISNANNVLITNVTLVGRRATPAAGTYDWQGGTSNNITFYNVTQSNFYDENGAPTLAYDNYWGVGGTSYCKNLTYDHCVLSRFDAHAGLHNGKIIDSTVSNVEIIGYGEMLIENTTFATRANPPIMLRGDYGCTWEGTIKLINCTMDVSSHKGYTNVLISGGWSNFDFGYTTHFPSIYIDNLKWKGLSVDVYEILINAFAVNDTVSESQLSDGTENLNRYIGPAFITVVNNNAGISYSIYDIPLFSDTDITGVYYAN